MLKNVKSDYFQGTTNELKLHCPDNVYVGKICNLKKSVDYQCVTKQALIFSSLYNSTWVNTDS